jgi:nucleoside-diphosphate-sugar epimerase
MMPLSADQTWISARKRAKPEWAADHLSSFQAGVLARSFIYTSTTSVLGDALIPPSGSQAAWITEEVTPVPRNIYGVTKSAAEDLYQLFHRNQGLPCVVLRTSRFFPEVDDNQEVREAFSEENLKANEYLYRRVDIEDVVSAHLLAAERAPDLTRELGFRKYIVSATTPFRREDLSRLRNEAPAVVGERVPGYEAVYRQRGWRMFPGIDRVYVNERAREELGWRPRYDFRSVVDCVGSSADFRSPLARAIGSKGYHDEVFAQGPYPVE